MPFFSGIAHYFKSTSFQCHFRFLGQNVKLGKFCWTCAACVASPNRTSSNASKMFPRFVTWAPNLICQPLRGDLHRVSPSQTAPSCKLNPIWCARLANWAVYMGRFDALNRFKGLRCNLCKCKCKWTRMTRIPARHCDQHIEPWAYKAV